MTTQKYGNHAMAEAWELGTGKLRQAPSRNNLTRRNCNII